MNEKSPLELERVKYSPPLPKQLRSLAKIKIVQKRASEHPETLHSIFPKTLGQPYLSFEENASSQNFEPISVGVVLSGGQASGGHNVITGLFDALKSLHPKSRLIGFLGGPGGIIENKSRELTREILAPYRNTGGFDLIGSGRTKIETPEQLASSVNAMKAHGLDGLVIIGGDDSNTNAAILNEYFHAHNCSTKVIGVPKTIDGDLKNAHVEISFGFDTACKVYAELIGNIARDVLSAKKYYHFIKLMGRSASHIALECALQVHPNYTLIGEEVASQKKSLFQISSEIADVVSERAKNGKNYGVILIPEGLIEFIPEIKMLMKELNALMSPTEEHGKKIDEMHALAEKRDYLSRHLSNEARKTFAFFPEEIQKQLLLDRDPHGNVQVSLIATEQLLMETVAKELKRRKEEGAYKGKFAALNHFFGYEGRSGFPSNFDAHYCYALGHVAALLIQEGFSGYMATMHGLTKPVEAWQAGAVPLTAMMHLEDRHGKKKPVIQKALIDLKGKPFARFSSLRDAWMTEDDYRFPGPIQLYGPNHLTDATTLTLQLESH